MKKAQSATMIILEMIMIVLTFLMVVATFYQANQSAKQVEESKRAIDLQYQPQIAIEFSSGRIPTVLKGNNYSKADYFQIYKNDLVGGTIYPQVYFPPVNITFYNLGNIGTRLERIRYHFSCDPKGERDWQIDIMKNRILLPLQQISYSNSLYLSFSEVPALMTWCNLDFKFFFYNNYTQEVHYRVLYQNFSDEWQKKKETDAYLKSMNLTG